MDREELDKLLESVHSKNKGILDSVSLFKDMCKLQSMHVDWDKNREIIRVFSVMAEHGFKNLTHVNGQFFGTKGIGHWIFTEGTINVYDDLMKAMKTLHWSIKDSQEYLLG